MDRVRYSVFPARLCLDEGCGYIAAPKPTFWALQVGDTLLPQGGWMFETYRGPDLGKVWLFVFTILAALLAASVAKAQPAPPCPIDAPALARLRVERAAMDAAGVACLEALDQARAERDRCTTLAVGRLADLAGAAAAQVDHLEALTQALDRPPEPAAAGRPWALVGLGGALVAGTAVGASALGASTSELAGATLGAAAVGAAVALVVTWATGG